MPEMLSLCGKSFRVQRRVDKICVADAGSLRRFPKGDVMILNGPRCDGNADDGCRIFWKEEAWLRPFDAEKMLELSAPRRPQQIERSS
jgi:hypothetical protein